MSSASNRHNRFATNLLTTLGLAYAVTLVKRSIRTRSCAFSCPRTFGFTIRTRWSFAGPIPRATLFQDAPALVFEVLSDGTRRIDEVEKRAAALVFRSTDQGFVREVCVGLETTLEFAEVGVKIALSELCERLKVLREEAVLSARNFRTCKWNR